MGLESGYGLNGFSSSGYLRDCNQGISWDIYLQVWLGRICFQAHLVVVGRTQFLVGFWTESLSSSLAVGQRLPSVPCKLGCSIGQLISWKLVSSNWMRERGEREMMNKMEISPVFYSLLRGGGGEGLHREGVDIRRPVTRSHFRSCLFYQPSWLLLHCWCPGFWPRSCAGWDLNTSHSFTPLCLYLGHSFHLNVLSTSMAIYESLRAQFKCHSSCRAFSDQI